MLKKHARGFTLIELIIVIVILGILAVTAVPRFLNLQNDAAGASLFGLKGAIQSAMKVVVSKAVIAGVEKEETATVEGIDISYGFPIATDDALKAAVDFTNLDFELFAEIGTTGGQDYVIYTFVNNQNVNENQCGLVYVEATATDRAYVDVIGPACGGKPPQEVIPQ